MRKPIDGSLSHRVHHVMFVFPLSSVALREDSRKCDKGSVHPQWPTMRIV